MSAPSYGTTEGHQDSETVDLLANAEEGRRGFVLPKKQKRGKGSGQQEQLTRQTAQGAEDDEEPEDTEPRETEDFEEDIYCAAIVTIVKDSQRIAAGSQYIKLRMTRMIITAFLLFANIFIQVFLLVQIKQFVTGKAVHDVRKSYDTFERAIYGKFVRVTPTGFAMGIGGKDGPFFNASAFSTILEADKENICRIPFSQCGYLFVILMIWTFTVCAELKIAYSLFIRLIVRMKTSKWMKSATRSSETDEMEEVVVALPATMKAFITFFLLIPRMVIALVLLWLGCRWLAATTNFTDLILNAVALEFIMLLNKLLYDSMVPDRNKRELQCFKIDITHEGGESPSIKTFLGTFSWGILAVFWVYFYIMYIQQVLPGYQFDVKDLCAEWIQRHYDTDIRKR